MEHSFIRRVDRRRFLKNTAAFGSAAFLASCTGNGGGGLVSGVTGPDGSSPDSETRGSSRGDAMPKRILGKTGLAVSVLSFGGGSAFYTSGGKDARLEKVERAFQQGINYFDTCSDYAWDSSAGSSEENIGEALSRYPRDQYVLQTKWEGRWKGEDFGRSVTTPDDLHADIEKSLTAMRVDKIDIWLRHWWSGGDLDNGGMAFWEEMVKIKEEGLVGAIGFSCMNSPPDRYVKTIVAIEPDVALLAMNPAKYEDVAGIVMPTVREKNTGFTAMKTMAGLDQAGTAEERLDYALNAYDGVASACVGFKQLEDIDEDAEIVKRIIDEGTGVKNRAIKRDYAELERRFRPYASPKYLYWARPDYVDGVPYGKDALMYV